MNKKMDKSSLIILIVVGVIVLAVAGYGIWQAVGTGKGGEETSSNASTVSDTIELNGENIKGIWEHTDGTTVHRLTFSDNQKLTYERFENGSNTAALTSTDGSYEISGNKVTISVTADGDTVTETCEAVLSKDGLILKATSEQSGFFAGDYKRSEQQEEPSSAPESSFSKPESTASAESSVPPESTASSEPKPESKPEPPAFNTELLLGHWYTISSIYTDPMPSTDKVYYTLSFDTNGTVQYQAGYYVDFGGDFVYTPFEETTYSYRLEGNNLHFSSGSNESIYVVESIQDTILNLRYTGGEPLNSLETIVFYTE